VARTRELSDPWYTAVYKNPHTRWWGPAAPMLVAVLLFNRLVLDNTRVESLLWAVPVVLIYSYLAYGAVQRTG
jgi:hypothetical protein